MHELLAMADGRSWTLAEVADTARREDVDAAIEAAQWRLRPLNEVEVVKRDADGQWVGQAKVVRDWLKPFGMMIAPGLAPEARTNWLNALLVSLSDLPADIVQAAAQKAMHKPMTFLNEVHGQVRSIAENMMAARRLALARLRDLQDEIRRAGDRSNELLSPPDELTLDDIRRMSPEMRAIGLGCGALTQAQIDEADSVPRAEAA